MTVNRGPGVSKVGAIGTTTTEHRLQLAGMYAENAPGVPRSGVLAQTTPLLVIGKTNMSYDIGPCALVISRTAAEGIYTPTLTGTTNVPTGNSPGSGSRWDLIWVKQNDTAKGDADNQAIAGVTQGLPGASPTKPYATVPAGAYVLAEAQIFSGTTGTSGGLNTLSQVWRHTAARGAPIPVRNLTERAELTPGEAVMVRRLDLAGRPLQTSDGTTWLSGAPERITVSTADATWAYNVTLTRNLNDDGSRTVNIAFVVARTSGGAFSAPVGSWTPIFASLIPPGWRPTDNVITVGGFEFNGMGSILVRFETNGDVKVAGITGPVSMGAPVKVCASINWLVAP